MRRDLPKVLEAAAPLIELALREDLGSGDLTSEALIPAGAEGRAVLLAKAAGIVCGLPICAEVFRRVDPRLRFLAQVQDGEPVAPGDEVAEVAGPLRGILAAERTALNFLSRLSGIATLTFQFVKAVANYPVVVLDTRKTTPGWRVLEKYAVRCGGGRNHRFGLYDRVLIKDNHLAYVGSVGEAVRRARGAGLVAVEVRDLEELREALDAGAAWILLDNMDLPTLRRAVALAKGRAFLEASGGITLARAAEVAATGVDAISVGALTHSAPALDFSLEVQA